MGLLVGALLQGQQVHLLATEGGSGRWTVSRAKTCLESSFNIDCGKNLTVVIRSGSDGMLATNGSSKRWTSFLLFLCALCSFITPAGKRYQVSSQSFKLFQCFNLLSAEHDADDDVH